MTDIKRRLQAYGEFFEGLTPEDMQQFDLLFSSNIHFKDPFNDVRGVEALKQVFTHMFEQCVNPRFHVSDHCGAGDQGYLYWSFHFTPKGRTGERRLEGVSRVIFDEDGRVVEHIDYWDPAEQIYSQVPLLGWVLDFVRRRLSAAAHKQS